jgi:cytoskeletal protein CcmA (bactofilin family)
MLQSNSNFDRAMPPERHALAGGSASSATTHERPADDVEASKIPVLGKTLLFHGELTAEEEFVLQGRVEGSIRHARSLIIGTDGSVLGDVYASHVTVEGLVEGDLHCSEAVIVRATAQVRGNIFAPRVGIMEGATFNGRVEMDPAAAAQASHGPSRQNPKQPVPPRPASAPPASGAKPGSAVAAARPGPASTPAAPGGAVPSGSVASGAPLAGAAVDQMLSPQSPQSPTRK